jgi:hypothetical protein
MTANAARKRMKFGEVVVAAGHVEQTSIDRALEIQRQRDAVGDSHKLLGLILLEMGEISNEQLITTLKAMQSASRAMPRASGS